MKTQKGFTLIELIIVIVVLGILAVTAAPQFFNFSSDARESTVKGLQGAVNGAKDIIYGKAAIAGLEKNEEETCGATGDAVCEVEGVELSYGYPVATADGIMAALNVGSDFSSVVATAAVGAVAIDDLVIFPADKSVTDDIDPDTECYVIYTQAADESTPPVITAVTSGC